MSIMKKNFGLRGGPVRTPQGGGTSQSSDPGTGNDETPVMVQECADGQEPQPVSSADTPTHPVHIRSDNSSSSESTDAQVDSTEQVPDEQPAEPLSSSGDTSVAEDPTAPEVPTPGNHEEQGEQQPAAVEQSISEQDTADATPESHSTPTPQAPLAPPIPPPARDGRPSSPRNDGLKTLTVHIEPKYHARLKKAAGDHGVTVKGMIVTMIENCFPAS